MRALFLSAGSVLCALAVLSPAKAEDLRGFYVGASIGRSDLQLEDADSSYDFDGHDTSYKLAAGYRIINWVAVEANYADYGRARDEIFGVDFEGRFTSYSLSVVGLWPIKDFDLFARAGVAQWDGSFTAVGSGARSSENSADPLFGFGAQYRLGKLALRAEVESLLLGFDDDGDDEADGDDWVSTYSVGFTYQFR
jgi:outer membrane protein with beta-barrel domain